MLAFLKRQPDFLILGAQKAGTSSLEFFLSQHPRIRCAGKKEVGFFSRDSMYNQGAAWYARQFPPRRRLGLRFFEATPEYLYYPFVAERIARFNPRMKLIVMLRNPVERAFSAWNMFRQMHADAVIRDRTIADYIADANPEAREPILGLLGRKEFPGFDSCVEEEMKLLREGTARELEPSFVRRGLYQEQLERFYEHFPPESIFILESAELKRDRAGAVNRVLAFLGLLPFEWPETALQDQHVRQYDAPMPDLARTALQKFFKEPNARLYSAIGRTFDWDRSPALPGGKTR
jgi:Sulfotransferase domain